MCFEAMKSHLLNISIAQYYINSNFEFNKTDNGWFDKVVLILERQLYALAEGTAEKKHTNIQ